MNDIAEIEKDIQNDQVKFLEMVKNVSALEVTDTATFSHALEMIATMKSIKDKAEQERKDMTKPLLDTKRKIDEKYKIISDNAEWCLKNLRKKVASYYGKHPDEVESLRVSECSVITPHGTKATFQRTKEIQEDKIDILALAKAVAEGRVPSRVLKPNMTEIRKLINAPDTLSAPDMREAGVPWTWTFTVRT